MNIPFGAQCNWCPCCDMECEDHPRICTVCGTTLQYPQDTSSNHNNNNNNNDSVVSASVTPDHLRVEALQASRELRQLVSQVRLQATAAAGGGAIMEEEWETIPAALLDPQHALNHNNSSSSSSRATATEYLKNSPRFPLTKNSALFYNASLSLLSANDDDDDNNNSRTFTAIPAEFGAGSSHYLSSSLLVEACLVLAEPKTGKGGSLSPQTVQEINDYQIQQPPKSVVLYMERGDNVTFLEKAWMAQRAGAKAVVIGNNQAEPWPYIMKDSTTNSSTSKNTTDDSSSTASDLRIPVVMIKQTDGQELVRLCSEKDCSIKQRVSLHLQRQQDHECVVCQEAFEEDGGTVMRIPACGHVFHETCALMWLEKHNTCPFCRRELPTDDEEYERERRRQQRTHAGSDGRVNDQFHAFYG